jgi:hypothetical protein
MDGFSVTRTLRNFHALRGGGFRICARLSLCPARSGNNATQIAEMAVKQQPPDMSELLWS